MNTNMDQSAGANSESQRESALCMARQLIYRFLALVLSDPKACRVQAVSDRTFIAAVRGAADWLCDEAGKLACALAPGEVSAQAFDVELIIGRLKDHADWQRQYEQTFGLMVSKKCPPYETEYCPQTFSVYRSQQLADIAGFYRAFGLEPSRDLPERHDHLALELEFMAFLIAKARRAEETPDKAAVCLEAQKHFFKDHLAWWVPAFALALRRRADRIGSVADIGLPPQSMYGAVAQALAAFIGIERTLLGIAPPTELMIPQPTADTEPGCEECCSVSLGGVK